MPIMADKEYHRNYYYKRDPAKLKQYRDTYAKKMKQRKIDREKSKRWQVKNKDKCKIYAKNWYEKNKEKLLERLNFEYRAQKLKEFADKVLDNENYNENRSV